MTRVADLVRALEELAPPRFAASWDNVGLLVGDPGQELTAVLLAIDSTPEVFAEAGEKGCEAIVSYHPPLFVAQKRFVAGSMAFEAARRNIAVYSPHTALDVAPGGTNDVLADAVGLRDRQPLRRLSEGIGGVEPRGFGRVGTVGRTTTHELVGRLKRSFGVRQVLVAGDVDRAVERVAVCAGSGGDLVDDAIAARAELLVTGELRHHDALRARAGGLNVVCLLHSVSERMALAPLQAAIAERLPEIVASRSEVDREPFAFV